MNIDKHIPPPPTIDNRKWPFGAMAVGDSVLIEKERAAGASNAARQFGFRTGKKFTQRKQPCGGLRIWRTA